MSDKQDVHQNGGRLWSVCTWGHSNLVIITKFLPNFIYRLLSSNSFPRSTMDIFRWTITKMATKMVARLSVCICEHSYLVIYHPMSSKFHIWTTFIKLLFMSENWFCLMNNNQGERQNGYPFSLQGIMRGPLSESDCSSFILKLNCSYQSCLINKCLS